MAMNTSTQLRFAGSTAPTTGYGQAEAPDKDPLMMGSGLTLIQRVAICFAAGVIGGLTVVLFGRALFVSGITQALGVDFPVTFKSPDVYRPLFWAGLWGVPFGLLIKSVWRR